jgi:aryl-alcohol dehydrogenase-like predicted oxidoreductase
MLPANALGRRDRVLVLTKLGLRWDDTQGQLWFETKDQNGVPRSVYRTARPESVRHEVEQSLRRLRIECIDLMQVHWPDAATPIEDTMGALLDLRRQGLVREIGLSNHGVDLLVRAKRALAGTEQGRVPLASTQPKYSLLARDVERDVLPWCHDESVGVLVYSPLEQGLLTGKVPASRSFDSTDGRHKRATFEAANRAKVNQVVESVLRPMAETHRATCAQVALAWVIAQPGVTAAIAGARTAAQAEENAGAAALQLSALELAQVRKAFEALQLHSPGAPPLWRRVLRWLRS